MYKTHPEEISNLFAVTLQGQLRRRLAAGRSKAVQTLEGGRLVCMVNGEMIPGVDIAWCLRYGRWPSQKLVLLSRDPHDMAIENIFPARLRHFRYRETKTETGFKHPLSKVSYTTPEACYQNWERTAREFYETDLPTVLAQEEQLQAQYRATIAANPHLAPQLSSRRVSPVKARKTRLLASERPPKPEDVPGRVWHWYQDAWLSVPEPVHPSDDWMLRCAAVSAGATRAEYDPAQQKTVYS